MAYINPSTILGARVMDVGWADLTVQTADGEQYRVTTVEGHSGPELDVTRVPKRRRIPETPFNRPVENDGFETSGKPRS